LILTLLDGERGGPFNSAVGQCDDRGLNAL